MNKRVSIVILNYRNWYDTIECLQSVLSITYQPRRVIIVDNHSQNDSVSRIRSWLAERSCDHLFLTQEQSEKEAYSDQSLVLIEASSNRGYAAGNNVGIRWAIRAGDDYTLILNNDTLVAGDFLEPMVDFLQNTPHAAVVGPKIVSLSGEVDPTCARRRLRKLDCFFEIGLFRSFFPNNPWHRRHHYLGENVHQTTCRVDIISGSCFLVSTEIMERIGLLDEKTFLYLEEFILHEKLRVLGKATYICPTRSIIHKGSRSTKNTAYLFVVEKFTESLQHYLEFYRACPRWLTQVLLLGLRSEYLLWKLKGLLAARRQTAEQPTTT